MAVVLVAAAGSLGAGADASDLAHNGKAGRRPADQTPWTGPLPTERKPVDLNPGAVVQAPSDRSLHFGTVTITPGGFLAIGPAGVHD